MPQQRAQLSDYLAVERTSLAWIRTGLAMMGFGFVVARFGLFLQEVQISQHTTSPVSTGTSLWFGTALIAVGVLVNLYSAWRHAALIRGLERNQDAAASHQWIQTTLVALLLVFVGIAMTIYLILIRKPGY